LEGLFANFGFLDREKNGEKNYPSCFDWFMWILILTVWQV